MWCAVSPLTEAGMEMHAGQQAKQAKQQAAVVSLQQHQGEHITPDLKLLQPLRVDSDLGLLQRDMQRLQAANPCFPHLQRNGCQHTIRATDTLPQAKHGSQVLLLHT